MGAFDWIRSVFKRRRERVEKAVQQAGEIGEPLGFDLYSYAGLDAIGDFLRIDQDLVARYLDYVEMMTYPEIAAAVDLYSEDATQPNTLTGETVWVESDDEEVREELRGMLRKRLDVEKEIWGIAKTLVMYGNSFEEVLVTKDEGVVGLHFLPPETMRRVEGKRGQLLGFLQDPAGAFRVRSEEFEEMLKKKRVVPSGVAVFEDWQVVHFRLQTKFRQSSYGESILEPARWIWKRLLLLEDAMMIYRLTRAPSRFAFYVEVGEMPMRQAARYVETVRQRYRKKRFINPATGKLDLRFSPLCFTGDTKVLLLDGTRRTFKELAAEGSPVWVYSYDLKRGGFVPGKARNPRKTGTKEVCRVHVDNGAVIRCTLDHRWLLRNGTWCEAADLTPGAGLMPFHGHESMGGLKHLEVEALPNHKVTKVEFTGEVEDVYDLTVEGYENFVLADADVVVHNSQDEDFFIPVRGGKESTRIEVLQGPDFPGSIDDVLYLYKKLLSALKIPPAYLGVEADVAAKNVLAHEDVRFARSVLRIQRELRNGLRKVCDIHLASRNIDPESVDYDVFMTVPSGIYELAQMEIRKARVEFAEMLGGYVSKRWVMREILGFSDDQIDQLMKEKKQEEGVEVGIEPMFSSPEGPAGPGAEPAPVENFGDLGKLRRRLPGDRVKKVMGARVLMESDENAGNKEFEKWLKKNLESVLEQNKVLKKRLEEVQKLCADMRIVMADGRRI